MEHFGDSVDENEDMYALREGIKNKYNGYHASDQDRFPDFDYNTNRANYQTLKDSFEVEFYEVRQLDRVSNNLHIPSTNTLSLIFSDPDFVPSKKILNTCRSYAEMRPSVASTQSDSVIMPQPEAMVTGKGKPVKLIWLVTILTTSIAVYAAVTYLNALSKSSGLIIHSPHNGQGVGRFLTVSGRVTNADTVWIIIRPIAWTKKYTPPIGWNTYYIQPPIKVNADGTWKGVVYIGGENKDHIGVKSQLRAFIHPDEKYRVIDDFERNVFSSWPYAELATEAIEVVRDR